MYFDPFFVRFINKHLLIQLTVVFQVTCDVAIDVDMNDLSKSKFVSKSLLDDRLLADCERVRDLDVLERAAACLPTWPPPLNDVPM